MDGWKSPGGGMDRAPYDASNDNAGTLQMTTLVGQLTDAKENSVTSICDAFIRSRSMQGYVFSEIALE